MTQTDCMAAPAERLPEQIDPSRAWILGILIADDGTATGFGNLNREDPITCQCLDDCPIDHENA
jgi:hypothetical protein